MVDDIRNYRPLTDIQITKLDNLTSEEKIKIIKEYNNMYKLLENLLHRPKRKMRQNIFMICIFYNYVSDNLLDVPLLFSSLKYLKLPYKYLRKYLDFLF